MENQDPLVTSLKLVYEKLDQLRYQKLNIVHSVRSKLYHERIFSFDGYPQKPKTMAKLYEEFVELQQQLGHRKDFFIKQESSLSQRWVDRINKLFLCVTEQILNTPLKLNQEYRKEWIFKDGSSYIHTSPNVLK